MSERILNALIQLFALVSLPRREAASRRGVVREFLAQQLNSQQVEEYLDIFDEFYNQHIEKINLSKNPDKRRSAVSVKILRITNEINAELSYYQKLIVTIQLLEFLNIHGEISDIEKEFVDTVALAFNLRDEEYEMLKEFILCNARTPARVVMTGKVVERGDLPCEGLEGEIHFLYLASATIFIFRFFRIKELQMNGQLLNEGRTYMLRPGSSIRNRRISPVFYSDLLRTITTGRTAAPFTYEAEQVTYHFNAQAVGLHPISFASQSGQLVGIMGASGSGKTTLINVLSGISVPSGGAIRINGVDVHHHPEKLKGLVGFVSQDDVLIEDLTVFENLYYNARLCFGNLNAQQLRRMATSMLRTLGLYNIRHMKVGSPMNKKISGGQRKRLNIALELIREPSILFLDEPTSGLSSHDSENIMDLLKELAIKGKLIYVVIHQPSSEIFKLFDQLLILDTGGYLIYSGQPVESLNYFKSSIHMANRSENECPVCGNVNVEQVLHIVSTPVVDEYGNFTHTRRITPMEWYRKFVASRKRADKSEESPRIPESNLKIPDRIRQFGVFFQRDLSAKLANRQYVLINLLETPILAVLLAGLIRYFNIDPSNVTGYTFMANPNLSIYLIMLVIIAFFVGLTLSAEEMINDRKILRREAFLNLSKLSYILSKFMLLALISAVQMAAMVWVGNAILEIKEMFWKYWLVLFSTAVFANLLGLNISDVFRKTVNVYIVIPFLVIPQLILSGVFLSYDRLNPHLSNVKGIPWYGETIVSRWAFEALAVEQFMHNPYESNFYLYDKAKSQAGFYKDYWVPALQNHLEKAYKYQRFAPEKVEEQAYSLALIRNELAEHRRKLRPLEIPSLNEFKPETFGDSGYWQGKRFLDQVKLLNMKRYNKADELHDQKRHTLMAQHPQAYIFELRDAYYNESMERYLRNSGSIFELKILEYEARLYQKSDPIFRDPRSGFFSAHLFAPYKTVHGYHLPTYLYNVSIIWAGNLLLLLTLYFGWFSKGFTLGRKARTRWFKPHRN